MATILYIKASPRGERSHSVTVADAFVKAYSEANPGDVVAYWTSSKPTCQPSARTLSWRGTCRGRATPSLRHRRLHGPP